MKIFDKEHILGFYDYENYCLLVTSIVIKLGPARRVDPGPGG
jgi:hypothetical protein